MVKALPWKGFYLESFPRKDVGSNPTTIAKSTAANIGLAIGRMKCKTMFYNRNHLKTEWSRMPSGNSKFVQKWLTVVHVNSSNYILNLVLYGNGSASNATSAQSCKTLGAIFYRPKNKMTNEFFRLKTEELLNEILQVKTFIKKHNPTIGILTEEILRKFLCTYLPSGVAVEQGFIIDENGNISKQIDIIIYDNLLYAPFYRINDIVVVPNKSVLEVIEIKTTVNSKTAFHEIINYFYSLSEILDYRTKKRLFIYNSSTTFKLNEYFHSFKHPGEYQMFDHDTFQNLPDTITGIQSSYHLGKDYVTFDRDMMGYTSYNYLDSTNTDISSLELFFKNIYDMVFEYNLSKTAKEFRNNNAFEFKSKGNLKSIFAIELFDM